AGVSSPGEQAPLAPRRPLLPRLLKAAIALAVLVSVGRALYGYRQALAGRLEHVHLGWLAVALVASIVYRVVNAYGWVLVLRAPGQRMEAAAGVRLWLVS